MEHSLDEQGQQACNITKDGLVKKTIIQNNEKGTNVSDHILGRVWINIKGTTADGIVFRNELFEEVSICLGRAEESKAIDQTLVTMKHGEHALVEVYDIEKYGYSSDKTPSKCPSTNEKKEQFPLKYELIVIDSLPKQKASHEMEFDEQLQHAQLLRERGNERYRKERYRTALGIYNRAIQCLDAMDDVGMARPHQTIDKLDVNRMKLKCFLNCSICHRRMKQHNDCITWCTKALDIDKESKKALIRRGLSYFDLNSYDLAKKDLTKFAKSAQDKKEKELIKKYLNKLNKAKQEERDKVKQIYGGFLDKKNKKNVSLYADKKNENNEKNNESMCWKIMTAIPNGIMYVIDECTKYCTKNKKKQL
eukprot:170797_1